MGPRAPLPPGRIHKLCVSLGGVPKRPVARARLGLMGLAGDRQRNLKFHGGPDRAVCLFSREVIEALRAEGHPIDPGAAGENITLEGIDLAGLAPGDRIALGESAIIEITKRVTPCRNIAGCFADGDFRHLDPETRPDRARLYARVLAPGDLAEGDLAQVLPPGEAS